MFYNLCITRNYSFVFSCFSILFSPFIFEGFHIVRKIANIIINALKFPASNKRDVRISSKYTYIQNRELDFDKCYDVYLQTN